MTAPIQPDKPWHLQKTPQEWQAILQQALKDHHANPQDTDAMEAIKHVEEAQKAYSQPALDAASHTMPNGWGNPIEAIKGTAEGGLDALLAPFHLANTVYRQGPSAAIDEVVNGITSIPGMIAGGDPRQIGRLGGNVAGGVALGKIGGKAAKVGGDFLDWRNLKNEHIKAQIESLNQGTSKASATMPDVLEQTGLRTRKMANDVTKAEGTTDAAIARPHLQNDILTEQLDGLSRKAAKETAMAPDALAQSGLKTELLKQGVAKGSNTLDDLIETPALRNEYLAKQIEMLTKRLNDMEEAGADVPETPIQPVAKPKITPKKKKK